MKSVGIVGGSGYAGAELTRWLSVHPEFSVFRVISDSFAGQRVDELYPSLRGITDLEYTPLDVNELGFICDAVFLAVPHKAAMAIAPHLVNRGVKVIDLSADYRIKDVETYESWYDTEHTSPELLDTAVYGLPELGRTGFFESELIACPGCYPTASTLAAMPALRKGLVDPSTPIVINALSGVSGAGRSATAKTHFCMQAGSVSPYGLTGHRHKPEIEQTYSALAGEKIGIVFNPHLVPIRRGLLATVTIPLSKRVTERRITELYEKAYEAEPFVRFIGYGESVQTASVARTNLADVSIALQDPQTLVATCAIDNLGKGAASQAVQCANLVFGFDETVGLVTPPAAL